MAAAAAAILVGEIGRPHGVRGLVKLRSFTVDPAAIASYGPLTDAKGERRFALTLLADGLARIEGCIDDREAAARLTGTGLYVERANLPPPEEDEFYLADLIGLPAETAAGELLGRIRRWTSTAPAPFSCWTARRSASCPSPAPASPWWTPRRAAWSSNCTRARRRTRQPHDDALARHRPDPLPRGVPGAARRVAGRRGLRDDLWQLDALDIRAFGIGRHRSVDDTPFGGGAGMVLRPDVVDAACEAALASAPDRPLVALTPRGEPLTQSTVRDLAAGPGVVLLCGRYEGVDQRVIEARGMREISVGDLRALGRRNRRHGAARRLRAPPARRDGRRRERRGGELRRRAICWNTRTTPARPSGTGAACPRCCSPATTPPSRAGAAPRPSAPPASAGPTCGPVAARGDHPTTRPKEGRAPPPLAARPDAA